MAPSGDLSFHISLPEGVRCLMARLADRGFLGFAVGGCVRDTLLGIPPHDWDLCTDATPSEMLGCFEGLRMLDTGLKHGTLTALMPDGPIEVTTFRSEGGYADHRRPDSVRFERALDRDLVRRDFTINAMAYRPETGLVDLFGGRADLRDRVLRCVGDAEERFSEDALRMLRALRFAARFRLTVADGTRRALYKCADDMAHVARERVYAETRALLLGADAGRVLGEYADLLAPWLPGSDEFCIRDAAVFFARLPMDVAARLSCLAPDAASADALCRGLKTETETRALAVSLAETRDEPLPETAPEVCRALASHGERAFALRIAIARAQGADTARAEDARARVRCWRVGDLMITGRELVGMGFQGSAVGHAQRTLLAAVTDGALPNERDSLMRMAKTLLTRS